MKVLGGPLLSPSMTTHRTFQSALLTVALLAAGAACSSTATTSPTDTPVDEPVAFADAGTGADPTTTLPDPAPAAATEPAVDPEPTPDPTIPVAPADVTDDEPVDPDPDPDPGPVVPTLDLGIELGTVPPTFDPVIVANLPACGLHPSIPANAANVTNAVVDAFGDGSADDTVTSYYDVDDDQWRIRLIPSAGGVSELTLAGVGPGYAATLGAVHVDTGDAEQILAVVGSGASALRLGVFGADSDGCLFRFVWHGSANPVEFTVGATAGTMTGVQCYEGDGWRYLSAIGAISNGPGTGTWNIYGSDALRETEQTLQGGDGIHVFGVDDGDPQLAAVPTVACPGIAI